MPHKRILFRSAAREKILRGATQLTDAIRVTLGPRSKSVLIEKKWGVPIVCNSFLPMFGANMAAYGPLIQINAAMIG